MVERYSDLTPVWTHGKGCELCAGTGYRGRVGVYELLVFTDAIRDMVVARATHHEIKALAMEEGMRTMQQEAFDLVAKGLTTVEDVLRSVYAPGMDDDNAPVGELMAGKQELQRGADQLPGSSVEEEDERRVTEVDSSGGARRTTGQDTPGTNGATGSSPQPVGTRSGEGD